MGDMSAEPSMEDILASIKRVIKEGETPGPPRRMSPRPVSVAPPVAEATDRDEDEVLELNQPLSHAPEPPSVPQPAPVAMQRPAPVASVEPAPRAGVSPATREAARDALGSLSRLIVKPDPASDGTLEGLVRDMLRPMLGEWLDANLPRLVEDMVAREIAKITDAQR